MHEIKRSTSDGALGSLKLVHWAVPPFDQVTTGDAGGGGATPAWYGTGHIIPLEFSIVD
jgi:hypothetical protein